MILLGYRAYWGDMVTSGLSCVVSPMEFATVPNWIDTSPLQRRPSLAPGQIHLWRTDLRRFEHENPHDLSPAEQQRASGLVNPLAQSRFVAGRLFLRRILGAYLEQSPERILFSITDGGKPQLDTRVAALEFNLSHTADLALLAIATRPIGVDVEVLNPKRHCMAIARRIFDDREVEKLEQLTGHERSYRFVQLWTHFEARQKAYGEGIFGRRIPKSEVHLESFQVDQQHLAAVAVKRPLPQPEFSFFSCYPTRGPGKLGGRLSHKSERTDGN